MLWNHKAHIKEGIMRDPTDSKAWKHYDGANPRFFYNPCNVRLGLRVTYSNHFLMHQLVTVLTCDIYSI